MKTKSLQTIGYIGRLFILLCFLFWLFTLTGCGAPAESPNVAGAGPIASEISVECFDINTAPGECFSLQEISISEPGYVYIEIANDTAATVKFFYHIEWFISGCTPTPIESFSNVIALSRGVLFNHEYTIAAARCTKIGPQTAILSLYDAESLDPTQYAGPQDYPRNTLISHSELRWLFVQ